MPLLNDDLIFDQYSRYQACADLVRQTGFVAGDSVLDVGSGPECLFPRFIPDAAMTCIDPLIPEKSGNMRIQGDVFSKKLDKKSFHCVTAVDVLEHVPPNVREAFLTRLASLSQNSLVLGFPSSDSKDALDVDQFVDREYQAIFGLEYPWLEEHRKFGLPSLVETIKFLEKMGWHCQFVGHGHAPWLKELLSFVICVWDIEALKELVFEISREFNKILYSSDFRAPYYRYFLVASRKPLPAITPPIATLSEAEAESAFRVLMQEAQAKYFAASMQALKLHDAVTKENDDAVKMLETIKNSPSWRVTAPLRFADRVIRDGLILQDRQRIGQALRQRYHRLPLPAPVKNLIRFAYHRVLRRNVRLIQDVILHGGLSAVLNGVPFHPPVPKPAPQQKGKPDFLVWGVIDWHFRHQRPQQLALALAATGRRVFYVSPKLLHDERAGFKAEALDAEGRLFQINLFVKGAPVIYSDAPSLDHIAQLRQSVGEMMDWAGCQQIVSMVDHPFWCDVASVVPNSRLVYDCMDHHEGFGNNAESLMSLEKTLLNDAEITITTSAWLDDLIAPHAKNRTLIRNACEYQHFAKTPETIYRDPQGRRIIGYFGAIADWFDVDLVEAVAKQHPDCSVLLIGADTVNASAQLKKLPNVTFLGEMPYHQLPQYLHGFDVCLLPFQVIPLTLATNPVKIYEYLAAGKPVVAVDLPEMAQFDGLVYTAADKQAFLAAVAKVLSQPEPATLVQQRKAFAELQTWQHRAEALMQAAESSEQDPKVSVVVVTYNNLEFTRACLASLDTYSQYAPMEIIVVDNASSDGSPAFLSKWAANGENRQVILNDDNRGFAAANNQGLAIATGAYLVLLNNDTYVTPGWIRTLIGHLKRDKTIGLIGPVTNNVGNEAKIEIAYTDMNEMLVQAAAYTCRHIGQTYPLRTPAFFCVMMPRTTYERVGVLDEAFGRGFFEDDDYCRRIEQLGMRTVCAEDVFIHHHLSASFDKMKQKDRQKLFEDNKKIYEAKWGPWVPHVYRSPVQHQESEITGDSDTFDGQKNIAGHCVICGQQSQFFYQDPALWRESLTCEHCRSTSRYRSIARGLLRAISELTRVSAPSLEDLPGASNQPLRVYDTQPPFYYTPCAYPLPDLLKATGWIEVELSNYKPHKPMGVKLAKGISNQNLECLTFADASLDIVITSDVMEHVRLDDRAHAEIYRVLKPGGVYLFTVPHNRGAEKTVTRVQITDPADPSKDVHLLEPEYHADANSDDPQGTLAYRLYGRELEEHLQQLGFAVDYTRNDMTELGILSTELYYCKKVG